MREIMAVQAILTYADVKPSETYHLQNIISSLYTSKHAMVYTPCQFSSGEPHILRH